jgi:hypothetical protein
MDIGKALETATVDETLFLWMTVHGYLCLALRHPESSGASRSYAEAFVKKIGRLLVDRGLLSQAELDFAEQVERQEMPPVAGIYEAGIGIVRLGKDDEATGE